MSLKIALILSVLLQFATAVIALTLIKRTRSNFAWWLISAGLVLMAVRRLYELFEVVAPDITFIDGLFSSWIGVIISVFMLVSLSFIKRIFNIQKRFDDLKKKNEARVFSAILRTEEEQKQKFSKELHDGLGPLLSSVKMAVSSIAKNEIAKNERRILENAEHLIDESVKTVKEISNNLSPQILNSFGLHKALKSFINKLQTDDGPIITLNSDISDKRYSYTVETVLYRVVCELITNTLKHADAGRIYIDLFTENDQLKLKYMDDGNGFEYNEDNNENFGFGLMNIQSRIKSVQGNCEIITEPGEGFNMDISVNLN